MHWTYMTIMIHKKKIIIGCFLAMTDALESKTVESLLPYLFAHWPINILALMYTYSLIV